MKLYMFRTVPLSNIKSFFSVHTGMVYVIQVCWQLVIRSIYSCSQAVSKPAWHIPLLYVQWKTLDIGQRNCPKHVEFYSKNKFEKLVHLVGFIVRKHTETVTKMIKIQLHGKQCVQKTYSCCYHHDTHLGGWGWQ
jgi:hypothetical protein